MNSEPYSARFVSQVEAERYENIEYSPDSYASYIWQLQKSVLQEIIRSAKNPSKFIKLLDFACGTGRVLSVVEKEVDQSDGIDVSSTMIEFARDKCPTSNIFIGNLLEQPSLLEEEYDIITCFRFLLNAEADTRIRVLNILGEKLSPKKGILITNIHGNSHSIRSLALLYRRIFRNEQHNQMNRLEIRNMFQVSGFRIIKEYGFGLLPPTLYRTPLRKIAMWVDQVSCNIPFLIRFSIDLLYVCQVESPTDQ